MEVTSSKKNQYDAIPLVLKIIKKTINPIKIILFGSCARKIITENSDIDICLVLEKKTTLKERIQIRAEILNKLLDVIDYEVDIYICSKEEWDKYSQDKSTLIGKINYEGKVLYG